MRFQTLLKCSEPEKVLLILSFARNSAVSLPVTHPVLPDFFLPGILGVVWTHKCVTLEPLVKRLRRLYNMHSHLHVHVICIDAERRRKFHDL